MVCDVGLAACFEGRVNRMEVEGEIENGPRVLACPAGDRQSEDARLEGGI